MRPWTCPRRKPGVTEGRLKSWRMYRHRFRKLNQAACADCGRGGTRSLKTGDGVQLVSQGYQNLEKHWVPVPALTVPRNALSL